MTVYEAGEIEQAFRCLQRGDNIGKVVVSIPTDTSQIASSPRPKEFSFKSDVSYLLTGGLGGLGRSVASWMVEKGARHLTFLSRSAGKGDGDQAFFRELESMGCSLIAVQGKADDLASVNACISQTPRPIKGIFHLAMVLRVCFLFLTLVPSQSIKSV